IRSGVAAAGGGAPAPRGPAARTTFLGAGAWGHDPRHLARVARLELANLRLEAERQSDLVPAGEQHLLAKRVDLEAMRRPAGGRHRLRLHVDRERRTRLRV